jgi:hypothetical protein
VAGYQANGYWIPGRWEFRGGRDREAFARIDRGRDRDFDRDRNGDRRNDRDRDHFRR